MSRQRKARGAISSGPVVAVSLVLLPLMLVLGCSRAGPTPAAEVIDLLELTEWRTPAATGLASADRITWNFSRGLPAGWSAGPAGVSVHQEEDGVRLEHPSQRPWLELRCGGKEGDPRLPAAGIDPLEFSRINIGLRPLGAAEAAVYYSFVDPGLYLRNLQSRTKYRKAKEHLVHGFGFPGADGFETGIRVLRLYPALVRESAVVRRAVLVPREPEYIADHVLSRGWVSLGQQYRRCWRLVGPGSREVNLRLPGSPSALRCALGCLVAETQAELVVELETASGAVCQLVKERAMPPGSGWRELAADLTKWAGEQVTLRFRVDGGDPGAVTLIGSPALLPAVAETTDDRPPNIMVILVDTLRADRLSLYGDGERTSPHLDRLARQGVVFTSAVAPSSWTLPSVAALLTGRYPGELKVGGGQGAKLAKGIPTLAEGFALAGYDTAGFSANFILNPFHGYARGFDAFYLAPVKQYSMPAADLNQRALDWLGQRSERPFFCYLQYMDPHSPYSPPGSDRFSPSNAETFQPRKADGYREGDIYGLIIGREELESTDHVSGVARCYEDEVCYVDFQIGRLIAALDRQGLLERTVVAVVADHGEELHDRGFWSHGYTLYDEQLHVPMIVSLPPGLSGQPHTAAAGQRIHTPVSLVDLFPTLFQLAGVETAEMPPEARNLFDAPVERGLISETWAGGVPPRFSLRQGPYKYVLFNRDAVGEEVPDQYPGRWIWDNGPAAEELYHLENDPGEQHNLAAELPEVAQRMRQELERRFGAAAVLASGTAKDEKMDKDTEERLRALGYIK